MKLLFKILYNTLFIPLLWLMFQVGKLFDEKVRRGIEGRKHLFKHLREELLKFPEQRKRILIHSSSLGEFEQAKPVIAELKATYPNLVIIASFFSPSGYEHAKLDGIVDVKTYLPFDSIRNAHAFSELVKPRLVMFMSYDLWSNHVWSFRKHHIPIIVANVRLRMQSMWKRFYYRLMFSDVQYLFTVSEHERENIQSLGLSNAVIDTIGETRFDQVLKRSEQAKEQQLLSQNITVSKRVFVVGSSWEEDNRVLIPTIKRLSNEIDNFVTVFAPHEPTEEVLRALERAFQDTCSTIRYSRLQQYSGENIILIDSIGILFPLYQYAQVAFVGGSFKANVHNILEPAVFGIPVLVGPNYKNSPEAIALLKQGGLISVQNEEELYAQVTDLFSDESLRGKVGAISKRFVEEHRGATKKIIHYVENILKLQSTL